MSRPLPHLPYDGEDYYLIGNCWGIMSMRNLKACRVYNSEQIHVAKYHIVLAADCLWKLYTSVKI
jgi:hypothetical protein